MEKKRGPASRKRSAQSGPSPVLAVVLTVAALLCVSGLLLCAAAKMILAMELPNRAAAPLGLAAAALGTSVGAAVFARCSKKKALGYGIAIGALLCTVLCIAGLIAGQQTFTLHSAIRMLALCCAGALGSALGGSSKRRMPH